MDFAAEDAADYNPSSAASDPIATLRTLVRVVRYMIVYWILFADVTQFFRYVLRPSVASISLLS